MKSEIYCTTAETGMCRGVAASYQHPSSMRSDVLICTVVLTTSVEARVFSMGT